MKNTENIFVLTLAEVAVTLSIIGHLVTSCARWSIMVVVAGRAEVARLAKVARCAVVAKMVEVASFLATSTHFCRGGEINSGNGSMLISGIGSMLISGTGSMKVGQITCFQPS